MQANNLLRRLVSTTVSKRSYGGHGIRASYNDLPTPVGSWKTQNEANQRKYNAHLAFGVIFLTGTILLAKASGFLYLNYTPPEKPLDD